MSESEGIGIGSLIRDMLDLAGDMDGFLSAIDSLDSGDTCTIAVTLSAFYKDGKWKLHVSDEFINAFMGYPDSEEYPEEVIQKIEALELEIEIRRRIGRRISKSGPMRGRRNLRTGLRGFLIKPPFWLVFF